MLPWNYKLLSHKETKQTDRRWAGIVCDMVRGWDTRWYGEHKWKG